MPNDSPNETNTKHSGRKYLYSNFMRRKQTAVGAWILLSVDKRWGRIICKSKKNDTIVRTHIYFFGGWEFYNTPAHYVIIYKRDVSF